MTPDDNRTAFEDHRHGLEFEHTLINRKVTWLLTSQTILFATLGLTHPSLELVRIVAWVALAICSIIAVGLFGNIMAKHAVYHDFSELALSREEATQPVRWGVRRNRVEFGVRTWTTWLGIAADFGIPLAFVAGWIFVLVFATDIVDAAQPPHE